MDDIVSAEELAMAMRFGGVTSAFREWCAKMRITPLPGRRGFYDRALVRRRLDEAQGLTAAPAAATLDAAGAALAARRARLGAR